ncbi:MAG: GSCFA domain-containing protein [Paludibacteraceae bacterium]|nr:GSCFA domain-containing protein [Paludibacteraceae bacterium]
MQLQTPVYIAPAVRPITYDDHLLFLGSCFADAVSACMATYYFRLTANPFGTLYNPLSIAQAMQLQEVPELVEWGGLYHSMAHHGDFSSPSREQTYARCAESILLMQSALSEATVVCVTFGTAWVYEMPTNAKANANAIAANCHKMPASRFTRRRLSVEEIVAAWQPILAAYSDKHFIFTVSPIRHLKDGLHENQLSKATLLQAVDRLCSISEAVYTPSAQRSYFPAFEIMLDELRDYRFYAEDMIHPSDQAVRYIFQRFVDVYCSDATKADMQALHQLYLDRQHRFLHPDSPEAAAFRARLEQKTASLRTRFPWI